MPAISKEKRSGQHAPRVSVPGQAQGSPGGIEPATFGFTNRRAVPLHYRLHVLHASIAQHSQRRLGRGQPNRQRNRWRRLLGSIDTVSAIWFADTWFPLCVGG